jgi:hypothetical protein
VDRLVVQRTATEPPNLPGGRGIVGELDGGSTWADILLNYGGGRYEVKAFDMNGTLLGTRRMQMSGPTKSPALPPEESAQLMYPSYPYYPPAPVAPEKPDNTVQLLVTAVLPVVLKMMDRPQMSFDQQMQLERERSTAQMALMSQMNAQMLQIVSSAKQSGDGLDTAVKLVGIVKDLGGDGGSGDPIQTALENGPALLTALQGFVRPQAGAPSAPQQQLPAARPPAVQQPAQPPTSQAAQMQAAGVFYQSLLAQGLSPEEAQAELNKCLKYLNERVEYKKQQAQAAQSQTDGNAPGAPETEAP